MGNETSTQANGGKRRIVKAVTPVPHQPERAEAAAQAAAQQQGDDSDFVVETTTMTTTTAHHHTNHTASSSTSSLSTMQPKTKAKRELKLQQHRLTPKSNDKGRNQQNNNAASTTTSTTTTTATPSPTPTAAPTTPSANPMSRFLSAFSVETKHPEHKRKQLQKEEQDDTPQPPLEKRLRADESNDGNHENQNNDKNSNITNNKPVFSDSLASVSVLAVTTICIVVGVAAMAAWRYKKR